MQSARGACLGVAAIPPRLRGPLGQRAAFEPEAGIIGSVTDDGLVEVLTMVTRGAVAGGAGDELSAKNSVRRRSRCCSASRSSVDLVPQAAGLRR